MTRDDAQKASDLLKRIKEYENAGDNIRKLYNKALDGDKDSITNLSYIALDLCENMAAELKNKLSQL